MSQTGVYVPVSAVFPELPNDAETFRLILKRLSRTDTLFWCARFNSILSNPANHDHKAKQQYVLNMCLGWAEIERVNRFAQEHGGVENVAVFFRGQLLELLRWTSVLCQDHPNDGDTFVDPDLQRTFAQAALIASDLWAQRIYGDRLSLTGGVERARERSLAAFRQSMADNNAGMEPLMALGRGRALFSEHFPRRLPSFEEQFQRKTGLTLDQYFTCAAALMTHYVGVTPDNAETKSRGIFNVQTVCRQVPHMEPLMSKYLAWDAQSPDDLGVALARGQPDEVDTAPPYRVLRERPVLVAADGRAIIIDPVFFAERASIGPLFIVTASAERRESNEIFGVGKVFEDYADEIFQSMYPEAAGLARRLTLRPQRRDRAGNIGELCDACLNDITELILIEEKAVWMREDTIVDPDDEAYLEQVRQKYGCRESQESRAKGVAQLARAIGRLASREWSAVDDDFSHVERIYPVLLVHDTLLEAPIHSHFLAREFAAALAPDDAPAIGDMRKGRFRVTPLILMTVEDLENLETSTRNFALRDLLSAYSAACPDRMESLRDFIVRSQFGQQLHYGQTIAAKSLDTLQQALRVMEANGSSD